MALNDIKLRRVEVGAFAFFRLKITGGRLVSGFGGAINLSARTLPSLLAVNMPS